MLLLSVQVSFFPSLAVGKEFCCRENSIAQSVVHAVRPTLIVGVQIKPRVIYPLNRTVFAHLKDVNVVVDAVLFPLVVVANNIVSLFPIGRVVCEVYSYFSIGVDVNGTLAVTDGSDDVVMVC